jgi:CubicO group peptidase (beta-lactamase class C family)
MFYRVFCRLLSVHAYRLDALQLLGEFSQAAVAAYPALSLSIAYINSSDVSTLHFSGDLVPQPDDTSIYEIASITKTFTGTLLGIAVASTELELSTPVKV